MSTSSHTCAVTIAGPEGRVDVVVPAQTPISELIPTFVELGVVPDTVGANGGRPVWALSAAGGGPLPRDKTLLACGITDGAVLTLTQIRSEAKAPPSPREVNRPRQRKGKPSDRTRSALPERLSGSARMSAAVQAFFGYEPEEPIVESAAPVDPSDRTRLTRAEHRSAGQRAKHSWRETDYIARLEHAISLPRLERCVTIAVVSPKGGVGKTTLTALLGSMLARTRRDRVVAVDTNPDYGSLGRTLTPDHGVYVDDLVDLLDRPDLTVTELDSQLGRAFEGLMVLPAPTDPERMARLDEAAYTAVIRRLQSMVGLLVLDCGTGLQEPAARAAQATADQFVMISDAQPSTASLVVEAAELLRTVGPPMTLVVNKLPRNSKEARIDLGGLEELIPDAQGMLTVVEDAAAATTVAAGEFAWRDAPDTWTRSVGELAVVLAEDWPRLGLAG